MEKGQIKQEEKEYRTPVSIFEAIRANNPPEDQTSSEEEDADVKTVDKEKKLSHLLFPFL